MNLRRIGFALLAVTIIAGLAPLVLGTEEIPTAQHHLLHAILLAGAAVSGIFIAGAARRTGTGSIGWLLIALISPMLVMLLMWPSEYAYFETHSFGHAAEHLGVIGLGFLTGFAGQRYAAGIGWATGMSAVAMAVLSVWGYGIAPASTVAATPVAAVTSAPTSVGNAAPDPAHGATIFKQNCAACHGAAGEGGGGPSLKNEASRKSTDEAEKWIEHPAPPMPQLYPGTLSKRDVTDVAAYVETLR
ncbi:MAG: c-type cytochrome [Candidatus Eremiobacteraeota bacterium]|nr:c-type cytochrome [Candidatus Eremiobacteraeota bacterium]